MENEKRTFLLSRDEVRIESEIVQLQKSAKWFNEWVPEIKKLGLPFSSIEDLTRIAASPIIDQVKQYFTPAAAVEVSGLKFKPAAIAEMLDLPDCTKAERGRDSVRKTMWYKYSLDGDKIVVKDEVKAEIKRSHEIYGTEKHRKILDKVLSICNSLNELSETVGHLSPSDLESMFQVIASDRNLRAPHKTFIRPSYKWITSK